MTVTSRARSDEAQRRGVIINLRATARIRELIDRAAALLGQSRSEFMLESACRHAEDVLLDQRLFIVDEERYKAFLDLLDQAPKPTAELRKLLSKKAPWE